MISLHLAFKSKSNSMRKLILSQIVLFILCAITQVSAQDVLLLQVNYINPDGSLTSKDLQFEISDNSKLSFIVNGKRRDKHIDLKIQPLEKLAGGIEVTGYDVETEGTEFNQFGIFDMRHMSSDERKAAIGLDYPLMVVLGNKEDSNNAKLLKAEIIKGTITKGDAPEEDRRIVFETIYEKGVSFTLLNDKRVIFKDNGKTHFMDVTLKEKFYNEKGGTTYNYKAKGDDYTDISIMDLRSMKISERKELLHGLDSPIAISMTNEKDKSKIKNLLVKIEEGFLGKEKKDKSKEDIHAELTTVFQALENDFQIGKQQKPTRKDDLVVTYDSNFEIGVFDESQFVGSPKNDYLDLGMISNNASEGKDFRILYEALESYENSNYKMTPLKDKFGDFLYLIQKSNQDLGFLTYSDASGKWALSIHQALDIQKIKDGLATYTKALENNPSSLKGKEISSSNEIKIHLSTKIIDGALIGRYESTSRQKLLNYSFGTYPMEALRHLIKATDFTIPNRKKEIQVDGVNEDGEEGLFIVYMGNKNYISIAVGQDAKAGTLLQIMFVE